MSDALARVALTQRRTPSTKDCCTCFKKSAALRSNQAKRRFWCNGRAFLGVHPRRGALRVNVVLQRALTSRRVDKVEQVSRGRFHNEVLLTVPDDLDEEFGGWVAEARALTESG